MQDNFFDLMNEIQSDIQREKDSK